MPNYESRKFCGLTYYFGENSSPRVERFVSWDLIIICIFKLSHLNLNFYYIENNLMFDHVWSPSNELEMATFSNYKIWKMLMRLHNT